MDVRKCSTGLCVFTVISVPSMTVVAIATLQHHTTLTPNKTNPAGVSLRVLVLVDRMNKQPKTFSLYYTAGVFCYNTDLEKM